MIMVDRARTITGVWRGRLSPPNQAKVIQRVFAD
jgi:hypothetical protein